MPDMADELDAMAKGLSEAQRLVLGKLERWDNPYGSTCRELETSIGTAKILCRKGLAISSQVYGGSVAFKITPLGIALRARLMEKNNAG